MDEPIAIDYYTDILCVWAWIAQRRTEELESTWGDKIDLKYRYVNVFGDTQTRIGDGWAEKGGFSGFGEHVFESAEPYDNAPVNPAIWSKVRPKTSSNAHLVLSAVAIESADAAATLAAGVSPSKISSLAVAVAATAVKTKTFRGDTAIPRGAASSPSWQWTTTAMAAGTRM